MGSGRVWRQVYLLKDLIWVKFNLCNLAGIGSVFLADHILKHNCQNFWLEKNGKGQTCLDEFF